MMLTLSRTSCATHTEPDDYRSELGRILLSQRHDQVCCDLKITVHGQRCFAHKAVLVARSSFFNSMFTGGFSERDSPSIDLSDVFENTRDLDSLLDYMYTGTITINEDNLSSVLNGASHFMLEELRSACSKFLMVNLCPRTCYPIWVLADRYSLTELSGACIEIFSAWINFDDQLLEEVANSSLAVILALKRSGVFNNLLSHTSERIAHTIEQQNTFDEGHLEKDMKDMHTLTEFFRSFPKLKSHASDWPGSSASGESEPQTSEALVACYTSLTQNEQNVSFEIHAFLPREKNWRFVLSHSFPKGMEFTEGIKFLCIGRDKCYFLQLDPEADTTSPENIFICDIESKKFKKIQTPPGYAWMPDGGSLANFFLFNDSLCLILQRQAPVDQSFWCIKRYDINQMKWVLVSYLPIIPNYTKFCVRVLGKNILLWTEERVFEDFLSWHVKSQWIEVRPEQQGDAIKYKPYVLASPPAIPDNYGEPLVYTNVAKIGEKSSKGQIHVCVRLESHFAEQLNFEWPEQELFRTLTYDCTNNSWTAGNISAVTFPKTVTSEPTRTPACRFFCRWPCNMICENLYGIAEDDGDGSHDDIHFSKTYRTTPELNIGAQYHAKTVSPYSSHIYLLRPWENDWENLPPLPFTTEYFPYMRVCDVNTDSIKTWPHSSFIDFSPTVGQSAFFNWLRADAEDKRELKFESEHLLSPERFYNEIYSEWQESLNTKSDSSDRMSE